MFQILVLMQFVTQSCLRLQHVSSAEQFEDILMNGLIASHFPHHCSNLMLGSSKHEIEGGCRSINDDDIAKCQQINEWRRRSGGSYISGCGKLRSCEIELWLWLWKAVEEGIEESEYASSPRDWHVAATAPLLFKIRLYYIMHHPSSKSMPAGSLAHNL
ncbi:unnamed protein product [Prunus armeniaca]